MLPFYYFLLFTLNAQCSRLSVVIMIKYNILYNVHRVNSCRIQ